VSMQKSGWVGGSVSTVLAIMHIMVPILLLGRHILWPNATLQVRHSA
jgi:hypothetical protein